MIIVFAWYLQHSLPVTPLNPRASSITVSSKDFSTTASPSSLISPSQTSLSVITPPAVTLKLLQEAKEAGVPAVWLQPGSFNDEVLKFARGAFQATIAGEEVGSDGVGSNAHDGWCVLVDGERGLGFAGRKWERVRL